MSTRRSLYKAAILSAVAGTLLASVLVTASIAAQVTPVFGPTQYTRSSGPPQTFTAAFKHCGTQHCEIVVINGKNQIKEEEKWRGEKNSVSIFLNGREIIGPDAFTDEARKIVKPVVLADQNQLITKLASEPGSFVTIEVECTTSPVILSLSGPGASVPNQQTLLSAVRVVNTGTADALNVHAKAITLPGGTLTSPSLPDNLGKIPAGDSTVLEAGFSGGPFAPGGDYPLTVTGTYAVKEKEKEWDERWRKERGRDEERDEETYCFTLNTDLVVPPAAPGSANVGTVQVTSQSAKGPYPPVPPTMDEDVNPEGWTVPTAPFVRLPTPPPSETGDTAATIGDPPPIVFDVNNPLGFTGAGQGCSKDPNAVCAEPSGAVAHVTGKEFVFATANWSAAYAQDETTFTQLDPTTVFPTNDGVGYCCDQIVQYVPSIDRFIWVLQGPGGYHLAAAEPADIIKNAYTAWAYWNLTPTLFGEKTASFDYPDLSVGDNYLYMSWDVRGVGLQVARIKLNDIKNGGSISIDFTAPSDSGLAYGGHLMQDTGNEIFWAGHNGNTTLRVFSWKEGPNKYYWNDVGISSWANNTLTSTTPDSQDWLQKANGFPSHSVIGATRNAGTLWFAWVAGTDGNFPQAHVEMVPVNFQGDPSHTYTAGQQVQIWNKNHAFAYPALATNICTGEVGLSLEYGGNGIYENHEVGIWGDFIVYRTTNSDLGTDRFGDYVSIRQVPKTDANPGNLFAAFGWGINKTNAGGRKTDVRYVRFGRPARCCTGNCGSGS